MTCREMVEFLTDFTNGELPPAQARIFEEHLDCCPPCLDYLESYKTTVRLGKAVCQIPDGPPPEEAPQELLRAILAARKAETEQRG